MSCVFRLQFLEHSRVYVHRGLPWEGFCIVWITCHGHVGIKHILRVLGTVVIQPTSLGVLLGGDS